jgi:hypothetical protein
MATLDFNNTVAALLLVQESQLTLRGLQLVHLAPVTAGYTSGSYVSNASLLWPSINAAPGTQVIRSAISKPCANICSNSRHGRISVLFGLLLRCRILELNMVWTFSFCGRRYTW